MKLYYLLIFFPWIYASAAAQDHVTAGGECEYERLECKNSNYPGPRYLKKYNISIGKVFNCSYHVITRGTCTPAFFDFQDIKLDDCFDGQP